MEELINKLSKEEKKAIEIVDDIAFIRGIRQDVHGELEDLKAIEDVLRLVEKQQEQLQEKDKIIDLMAENINLQNDILYDFDNSISYLPCNAEQPMKKCLTNKCKQCIIEYFTKKAREV